MRARVSLLASSVAATITALACTDLSSYSTSPGTQYAGCVVPAGFVLTGVATGTEACLTLDANQLQTAPGNLSTSDGRFQGAPLRPIPQIWNDPLSTFNFGEGRTRNLLYMAAPSPDAAGGGGDVTVVVSLMDSGRVEIRLLRGAPPVGAPDATSPSPAAGPDVFAVFPMKLVKNGCEELSASNCGPDASLP